MTNSDDAVNARQLILVSGATGDLGRAYLTHYSKLANTRCYGLLRRKEQKPLENVHYYMTDLEDAARTQETIACIPLEGIEKILFIHPVGKFKFENDSHPHIDDEILTSNVGTFCNIVKPLLDRRATIPFTIVAFGSLSDSYNVPWWSSYTKSKLLLRQEMSSLARLNPNIHSIFVNLSSVQTSNERKTRPFADMGYWIKPEEIVTRTTAIIDNSHLPYTEIDVYNACPEYHAGYYSDFPALKEKWLKEMGH